ncbi:MAG TPA: N-6 DNA methylase, partial [Pseudomonadota bacterium]|nr:N-6 DNA methylase [Pseudomonadota bacterium]
SEIRRWLLENDWLEAIVALPESMFYNTGIGTYIWVVTNRKEQRRKGKVQLLDARDVWTAGGSEDSKRSLGDKRRHMAISQIDEIGVQVAEQLDRGPQRQHGQRSEQSQNGTCARAGHRDVADDGPVQRGWALGGAILR